MRYQFSEDPERGARKPVTERLTESRPLAWMTLGLALLVLAIVVLAGSLHLRSHLREHLAERDGEILTAVALARQYANGSGSNLTQRLHNPPDQLALALEISQLQEGVLGVRLFDHHGRYETALPLTLSATNLSGADLPRLRSLRPVSRFYEQADLAEFFLVETTDSVRRIPVLEVTIPLYAHGDSNLVAAAQLLIDGHSIVREYARVDHHLWVLTAGTYLAGAILLAAILVWSFRRLRNAQTVVEERTARLTRANHELTLAAKTTALGSVTAHLVHGLSNPLANLHHFVDEHKQGASEDDLKVLAFSTRRMQQLVEEVLRVLGEEHGGDHYEITLSEVAEVLTRKLGSAARESGARLEIEKLAPGSLSNRHANLVLLILENLVHNALKVTPVNGCVRLSFAEEDDGIRCEVIDDGPGISPEVASRLFSPCRSTQGGSGLGLAISKQLANQLGAQFYLKRNSPTGCVFALFLPAALLCETNVSEAVKS